jgi:tetratricopeptide (TPR) repeat protein
VSSKLQQAIAFQQSGNVAKARVICAEILAAQPKNIDALYLLGRIALQEGQYDAAAGLLHKVVSISPNHAAAHHSYGAVLSETGHREAALASYDRAIALQPGFAQAHFSRATVLKKLGCLEAALDSYDRAIAVLPDYADAYFNRGNVLYELKQLEAALVSYDLAITHNPTHAGAYCNRAVVLSELGRGEAAVSSYDRAIAINPRNAGAHYSRGVALKELARLDESLASYSQAIAINPGFAAAYSNRGVVLKDLGQWDAALADYERAIALNENLAETHSNKGNLLAALGQIEAAIASFDRAITLKGDFAKAHFSRATTWLLAGEYDRGWPAYEWRWQRGSGVGAIEKRGYATALWLGNETPIAGRTILLWAEQGLGDTLQFCRYATLVANLGARVILEVPQPLKTILAGVEGVSDVVVSGETLPCFDFHCPLMSLPLAFRTTLDTVPAPRRYIHSPNDRVRFWKEQLANCQRKLKVGIVWSGGSRPNQPEAWPALNRRNIPLAYFACLRHPDIEFYSLQIGHPAAADLAHLVTGHWEGPDIIDNTHLLADFSDTAGFIENLDLVITVDTSTAHLAGALGKPVWILNRFDTCWRWLLRRDDSPWYPSAKIYRQESPGHWDSVMQRIRSDLFQLVS